MDDIREESRVRFLCQQKHDYMPDIYPPVGTAGTVIAVKDDEEIALVQWDCSGGFFGQPWWVAVDEVEAI